MRPFDIRIPRILGVKRQIEPVDKPPIFSSYLLNTRLLEDGTLTRRSGYSKYINRDNVLGRSFEAISQLPQYTPEGDGALPLDKYYSSHGRETIIRVIKDGVFYVFFLGVGYNIKGEVQYPLLWRVKYSKEDSDKNSEQKVVVWINEQGSNSSLGRAYNPSVLDPNRGFIDISGYYDSLGETIYVVVSYAQGDWDGYVRLFKIMDLFSSNFTPSIEELGAFQYRQDHIPTHDLDIFYDNGDVFICLGGRHRISDTYNLSVYHWDGSNFNRIESLDNAFWGSFSFQSGSGIKYIYYMHYINNIMKIKRREIFSPDDDEIYQLSADLSSYLNSSPENVIENRHLIVYDENGDHYLVWRDWNGNLNVFDKNGQSLGFNDGVSFLPSIPIVFRNDIWVGSCYHNWSAIIRKGVLWVYRIYNYDTIEFKLIVIDPRNPYYKGKEPKNWQTLVFSENLQGELITFLNIIKHSDSLYVSYNFQIFEGLSYHYHMRVNATITYGENPNLTIDQIFNYYKERIRVAPYSDLISLESTDAISDREDVLVAKMSDGYLYEFVDGFWRRLIFDPYVNDPDMFRCGDKVYFWVNNGVLFVGQLDRIDNTYNQLRYVNVERRFFEPNNFIRGSYLIIDKPQLLYADIYYKYFHPLSDVPGSNGASKSNTWSGLENAYYKRFWELSDFNLVYQGLRKPYYEWNYDTGEVWWVNKPIAESPYRYFDIADDNYYGKRLRVRLKQPYIEVYLGIAFRYDTGEISTLHCFGANSNYRTSNWDGYYVEADFGNSVPFKMGIEATGIDGTDHPNITYNAHYPYINIKISIPLNRYNISPNIRSVCVFIGERVLETQGIRDVVYRLAKEVYISDYHYPVVSQEWKGYPAWSLNSNKAEAEIIIDANCYFNSLHNATAVDMMGHGNIFKEDDKNNYLDSYGYGVILGDYAFYAPVVKNGKSYDGRLYYSGVGSQGGITYPVYSSVGEANFISVPFKINRIARYGDDLLVVFGDRDIMWGHISGDPPSWTLRGTLQDLGCRYPNSISPITEMSETGRVSGLMFCSEEGLRVFTIYDSKVISSDINEDYEDIRSSGISNRLGLRSILRDDRNVMTIHLPDLRLLMVYSPLYNTIWVRDFRAESYVYGGGNYWMEWRFAHKIRDWCKSVRGTLLFTDGQEVYEWSDGGEDTDSGEKILVEGRLSEISWGKRGALSLRELMVDYGAEWNENDSGFTLYIIKDSGVYNDFALSLPQQSKRKMFYKEIGILGGKAQNSISLAFKFDGGEGSKFYLNGLGIRGNIFLES